MNETEPDNPYGLDFPTYEGQCSYPVEYDATDGACPAWWRGQDRVNEYFEKLKTERDRLRRGAKLVCKMLDNPHVYRTEPGLLSDLLRRALEKE